MNSFLPPLFLSLSLVFLAHCTTDEESEACNENECLDLVEEPGVEPDISSKLYKKEMVDINIVIDPSDWDTIRNQYRSVHSLFGSEGCHNQQLPKPYSYFPSTVTIDGTVIPNSTIRKKGLIGSQSTKKPSLKVRFDHINTEQRYLGTDGFALNNLKSDPSLIRSCLTSNILEDIGVPSSRCTFANVTINDASFGVFALVEEVKKPFLKRAFDDDDGNLYEGTVNDFVPELIDGFEQDTNELSDSSRDDLSNALEAIKRHSNKTPDSPLQELDTYFNLDAFYSFWAAEILVSHRDGYAGNANNFYIYANPLDNGRFHFIPWGVDFTLKREARANVPKSVYAFGKLANLLYQNENSRNNLFAALRSHLQNGFDERELLDWIEDKRLLLEPYMLPSDVNFFEPDFESLRDYINIRRKDIDDSLNDGHPEWSAGTRGPICRTEAGTIQGSIRVNWDSLQEDWWTSAIAGELNFELDDQPFSNIVSVGARAGIHEPSGRKWLIMLFDTEDDTRYQLSLLMPDPRFFDDIEEGLPRTYYSPEFSGSMWIQDLSLPNRPFLDRYELGEGTINPIEVNTNAGGHIEVSFENKVYKVP